MRWYLQCAIDNLKGLIPAQTLLRDCKRRFFPYKGSEPRADSVIEEGIKLINFVRSSRDIATAVCLEIGAGWEPLIPILFSLCSAQKIIMTDQHRLCSSSTVASAINSLSRNRDLIASGLGLDREKVARLLDCGPLEMEGVFRLFRLEYIAPCGCARLPVADGAVDVVYSRAVLEHLPPSLIEEAFRESRRVLADCGVMCHFIDPSDHLEHRDKRISRIHFLRFSDTVFRLMCLNTLHYHNRMRHSEYARMLEQSGFEIVEQERNIDPHAVVFARTQELAPKFRQFSLEDLATVDSFFLARVCAKAGSGGGQC